MTLRIPSEVLRIREHFLRRLAEWQWALAKHGIAAGEATDDATIHIHLQAAKADLSYISESGRLLGFTKFADDAEYIARMITLFLDRCVDSPNMDKVLTDLILELTTFVETCKQLEYQPTVLEDIKIQPPLSKPVQHHQT